LLRFLFILLNLATSIKLREHLRQLRSLRLVNLSLFLCTDVARAKQVWVVLAGDFSLRHRCEDPVAKGDRFEGVSMPLHRLRMS
jgi:hypothetical protein